METFALILLFAGAGAAVGGRELMRLWSRGDFSGSSVTPQTPNLPKVSISYIDHRTDPPFPSSPSNPMPAPAAPGQGIADNATRLDPRELDFLARTIWAEARGEGPEGMRAVATIIHNRVRSFKFPDSYELVVTQPWQFSPWNKNDPQRPRMLSVGESDALFRSAKRIAAEVMNGSVKREYSAPDWLHFANLATSSPSWAAAAKAVSKFGKHTFFKGVP